MLPSPIELNSTAFHIAKSLKPIPFNCLRASVFAATILEHEFPNNDVKVKTGNFSYKGISLFTQNYSLNSFSDSTTNTIRNDWEGHAWVEFENRLILDFSLFDTVRSDAFILSIKDDIIKNYATGRGVFIHDNEEPNLDFSYKAIDILNDRTIDSVNQGIIAEQSIFLND